MIYLQNIYIFFIKDTYSSNIATMFGLDLKSLMQVANTTEKPKLMHKRFRCGKVR